MKQSMKTLLTTSGLLLLTLMLSGIIKASGSSEPGMEEILAEGIPHPPVIIDMKEYRGDRSTPSKAEFLVEGIPHPQTDPEKQKFSGDPVWPDSEKMMAEDSVTIPSQKNENVLADTKM